MAAKSVASPTASDAVICNTFQPPIPGVPAGGGLHVVIPADYAARILAGQEVPGCTYAHLEEDGSLIVTDTVQAALAIPARIQALTAPQQAIATALITKLATAIVVS